MQLFQAETCILQADPYNGPVLSARPKPSRRSGCPVSVSLERIGDRWSLLIVRDLMVRGFRTFREFQRAGEGIASNILADRLRRLRAAGIIAAEREQSDARRVNYRLTRKGIDLAPVVLELLLWAARHEKTGASCALIDHMAGHREQVLEEVRRRWRHRDPTPFFPPSALKPPTRINQPQNLKSKGDTSR